jgi:hypothetical protein
MVTHTKSNLPLLLCHAFKTSHFFASLKGFYCVLNDV